jgi:NDP-4-keto-2,6-dideoxyhexose 3-C-methyltransferase
VDVEFNDINGGSFSVVAAKEKSRHQPSMCVDEAFRLENELQLETLSPYLAFARRVAASRDALRGFVVRARQSGRTVAGLGASTKGNVILQYCGFTTNDIARIGEVNEDKVGSYCPGSLIPIVPERQLLASAPDYLLVLPWHFRQFFETNGRFAGQRLVFPLPELEVLGPPAPGID